MRSWSQPRAARAVWPATGGQCLEWFEQRRVNLRQITNLAIVRQSRVSGRPCFFFLSRSERNGHFASCNAFFQQGPPPASRPPPAGMQRESGFRHQFGQHQGGRFSSIRRLSSCAPCQSLESAVLVIGQADGECGHVQSPSEMLRVMICNPAKSSCPLRRSRTLRLMMSLAQAPSGKPKIRLLAISILVKWHFNPENSRFKTPCWQPNPGSSWKAARTVCRVFKIFLFSTYKT